MSTCGLSAVGCVEACEGLATDVQDCRIIHCGLAQSAAADNDEPNRQLHCMHAQGMGLCE